MLDTEGYSRVIDKLRRFFFDQKGFIEVPAQCRRSILSACEEPKTMALYEIDALFPLPQTGQMWLEHEILKNPSAPGYFCVTTSYRNEPNPIPGRHDKIFPMFEFESHGSMDTLRRLEAELLQHLGFKEAVHVQYDALCNQYDTPILEARHEEMMQAEFGPCISLEQFPRRTDPFWNMKECNDGSFSKIDIILCGQETIGSAERSCNPEQMRHNFNSVSGGQYAQRLFEAFGHDRVMKELDAYLAMPMISRFGGGIGITRLVRSMRQENLI